MAYVTMEATMLICPAEQFLYVLYWLQKLVCWFFWGGGGGVVGWWWGFFRIAKISSGELCGRTES